MWLRVAQWPEHVEILLSAPQPTPKPHLLLVLATIASSAKEYSLAMVYNTLKVTETSMKMSSSKDIITQFQNLTQTLAGESVIITVNLRRLTFSFMHFSSRQQLCAWKSPYMHSALPQRTLPTVAFETVPDQPWPFPVLLRTIIDNPNKK